MKTLNYKNILASLIALTTVPSMLACNLTPKAILGEEPVEPITIAGAGPTAQCSTTWDSSMNEVNNCQMPTGRIASATVDTGGVVKILVKRLTDGAFPKITALQYSSFIHRTLYSPIVDFDCTDSVVSSDNRFKEIDCRPKTALRISPSMESVSDVDLTLSKITVQNAACGSSITYTPWQSQYYNNWNCQSPEHMDQVELQGEGGDNVIFPALWLED
jgi:hypothetical protein